MTAGRQCRLPTTQNTTKVLSSHRTSTYTKTSGSSNWVFHVLFHSGCFFWSLIVFVFLAAARPFFTGYFEWSNMNLPTMISCCLSGVGMMSFLMKSSELLVPVISGMLFVTCIIFSTLVFGIQSTLRHGAWLHKCTNHTFFELHEVHCNALTAGLLLCLLTMLVTLLVFTSYLVYVWWCESTNEKGEMMDNKTCSSLEQQLLGDRSDGIGKMQGLPDSLSAGLIATILISSFGMVIPVVILECIPHCPTDTDVKWARTCFPIMVFSSLTVVGLLGVWMQESELMSYTICAMGFGGCLFLDGFITRITKSLSVHGSWSASFSLNENCHHNFFFEQNKTRCLWHTVSMLMFWLSGLFFFTFATFAIAKFWKDTKNHNKRQKSY